MLQERFLRARRDWALMVSLYLLAFVLRFWIRGAAIYGDEGFHYYVSRTWGGDVPGMHYLAGDNTYSTSRFFWWRPAFMALLFPGSVLSFEAYRVLFIAYASLLPPLAFAILRQARVRWMIASGTGLALALHPYFVVWGVRVFPDALMTIPFGFGLLLWLRRQYWAMGAAFLLAVWCKETAIVGVAAMAAIHALHRREEAIRFWPLQLDRALSAFAAIALVGLMPLQYALAQGLQFPGWSKGGDAGSAFDQLVLSLWLLPILLVGLAWRRTRPLALLALVYPAFYVARILFAEGALEAWYLALPWFLVLLAVALTVDELFRRGSRRGRGPKAAAAAAGVAVGLLLLAAVFVPGTVAAKSWMLPVARFPPNDLTGTMRDEMARDLDLPDLLAQMRPTDWNALFLVDAHWFFQLHPFSTNAQVLRLGESWHPVGPGDLRAWSRVAEQMTEATVVQKTPTALNEVFRETYAACRTYENPSYVLYHMQECQGSGERLAAAYMEQTETGA